MLGGNFVVTNITRLVYLELIDAVVDSDTSGKIRIY